MSMMSKLGTTALNVATSPAATKAATTALKLAGPAAAAAVTAAAPIVVKAGEEASKAYEKSVTAPEKKGWFTRKAEATPEKKGWFTRKAEATTPTANTNTPTANTAATPEANTAPAAAPTEAPAANTANTHTAEATAPTEPATEETVPKTTEEENLVKKFLQKVRKGDLTDVVNSINGVKPETDELSIFEQIKKDAKSGKFEDIMKSLPSPPPFPTAVVMQIVGALNDIFQQNIGKVSKFAEAAIDAELEKKKNELELSKALGEQAKKTDLKSQMTTYVQHVLNK